MAEPEQTATEAIVAAAIDWWVSGCEEQFKIELGEAVERYLKEEL